MEKPELYHLTRIRWQFFGTLTFRAAEVPERIRLGMWFSVARKCAKNFGLHFHTLPWCLRQESGETTGRRHFHVLLGGLPETAVTLQTCMVLKNQWQRFLVKRCDKPKCKTCQDKAKSRQKHLVEYENPSWNAGGGMAQFRLFDRRLNGVDYISKQLGMSGADVYESAKFGASSSGLMLSKGGQKILFRYIREERRHIERLDQRRVETEVGSGLVQEVVSSS